MIRDEYIKRLKERLREKPDSRLFLSLAEELKKDDRLNEAIDVLINGIRKVPDFDAARLTLGRWYLESSMLSEAKKEFSEILKHSPNNIFAIKWLNEIDSNESKVTSNEKSDSSQYQSVKASKTQSIKDSDTLTLGTSDTLSVTRHSSLSHTEPYAQLLEAEKLIETGRYQAAMKIYNAILMSNPEYIKALQKREELISLMNITGKGKKQVLNRLNTFLNAIRVRFIEKPAEKPADRDKNSIINSLNKFLEAVKIRFAAAPS
jgi:tetratricopeptide (TPR) repeat protein